MQVKEIMSRNVQLVDSSTPLRDAAELMRDHDIGALPVGESGRLTGMITDRDLVVRGLAEGKDGALTTIREIMTPRLSFVFEDADVEEAARVMQEHQVRRLPVLDGAKRLVGVVSLGDIGRGQDSELKSETLTAVSEVRSAQRSS